MKIARLYPSGKRRSANGLRDEAKTSKWPDFAPLITFIGVACFTASLTYVAGLSAGLNQNLMGFFDLTDFLRITPAWAIPAIGFSVLLNLRSYLADAHRAKEQNLSVSEPKNKWEKFFRLIRHFAPEATGLLIGLTVVVTYILSFFVRHKWFLLTVPVEGKVFLELNRFILFVAPENKVTAVAASDVNWIEFSKAGAKYHKENPK